MQPTKTGHPSGFSYGRACKRPGGHARSGRGPPHAQKSSVCLRISPVGVIVAS